MSGVLKRSWNSDIPLRLSHVIITKTLGIHQAIDIRALILKCMGLWEEGVHSILVVDEEAEGVAREVRDAREEQEEYGQAKAFHVTVLPGKLRQAVHQENDREGGVSSWIIYARRLGNLSRGSSSRSTLTCVYSPWKIPHAPPSNNMRTYTK